MGIRIPCQPNFVVRQKKILDMVVIRFAAGTERLAATYEAMLADASALAEAGHRPDMSSP